jgi:hypothetical protein
VLLLPLINERDTPQMPKEATRRSMRSLATQVWAALLRIWNIETQTSHFLSPVRGQSIRRSLEQSGEEMKGYRTKT